MARLTRQGSRYIAAGIAQLVVDWALFVAATSLGAPVPHANIGGRLAGMLLGFWLNGRYTFAEAGQQRLGWRRFVRFLLLWVTLTAASTLLLSQATDLLGLRWAWLAKPVVEGGLAVVSFVVMRLFVFR